MASLICVMGESGSGKTTSLRNLDPSTTYIIDADKKGLSWRGWKSQYNDAAKNYRAEDDNQVVLSMLKVIDKNPNYSHVRVLVIDTINGIMVATEAHDRRKKGYDKWNDLAWSVYDIIDYALTARDDLTVVFMAHSQTERDDSGVLFTHVKTSGRKLDKIVLESKFTTVLNAKCLDGEYVFETRNPLSTAKTPLGLFDADAIPNDINQVIDALNEYNGVSTRKEA